MRKMIHMLNGFVFVAATLTIMGIVYEGYALKWFPVIGGLIITMDCLFMLSTIVNLIFGRASKVILSFSIISLILIMIAIIMKALTIEYPVITLVLWDFYIWFYYGFMLSKKL